MEEEAACVREKERVEEAIFRGLSWQEGSKVLLPQNLPPPPWCDLSPFAEIDWDYRGQVQGDYSGKFGSRTRESLGVPKNNGARANLTVWLNDMKEASFSEVVEHGFVQWMQARGKDTGKWEWSVALVGDSTLRGIASSWIRMMAGPQPWLSAFDR